MRCWLSSSVRSIRCGLCFTNETWASTAHPASGLRPKAMAVRTDEVALGEFREEDLIGSGIHLAHGEGLGLTMV